MPSDWRELELQRISCLLAPTFVLFDKSAGCSVALVMILQTIATRLKRRGLGAVTQQFVALAKQGKRRCKMSKLMDMVQLIVALPS